MIFLYAALSMCAKDGAGTLLVIAEARGRSVLAGALDALGDLALIAVTVTGAGQIIEHGVTGRSIAVVAVIVFVSFWGTLFWTRVGTRLMPEDT